MSLTSRYMTPNAQCFEKREIPTVSEFDKIRRGAYILRDNSNGEVRFVIRDLEKFRIFTEMTILPFFRKLEFSRVLQYQNTVQYVHLYKQFIFNNHAIFICKHFTIICLKSIKANQYAFLMHLEQTFSIIETRI